MKDNTKAILFALISILSWSTVATAFKTALKSYSQYELLTVACTSALLIFAISLTCKSKWGLVAKLSGRQWQRLALIAALNPVAYYLVLFKSYDLLPAQIAQPINYSWPIVLAVFMSIYTKKPLPKSKYVGMFLSLIGVVLISFGSGGFGNQNLPILGLLLALMSAFLWAAFWVINHVNKDIDNTVSLFATFLFGSVYLIFGAFFVNVHFNSMSGLLASIYAGSFEMGISFIFFGLALRKTNNPTLINQLCYVSPFISLFIIHIVLNEQIYPTTYTGLFLIVLGILFNEYLTKIRFRKYLKLR